MTPRIYRHTLTSPDTSTVPVTIYTPAAGDLSVGTLIILIPGLGVEAELYGLCARFLCQRGYSVLVIELRGQGESQPKPSAQSTYGHHHIVTEDIKGALSLAASLFPQSKIYLAGHSMGGILAVLAATRYREYISGIILLASGISYYRNYGFSGMKILSAALGVRTLVATQGYKPPTQWDTYGAQSGPLMNEWANMSLNGEWKLQGADINYTTQARALTCKVLTIRYRGDTDLPEKTLTTLLNFIPQASITRILLDDSSAPGHNGWITSPKSTVDNIDNWLQKQSC